MKTVIARLLPQTDLNIGFAIVQDDGTVRQYYASQEFLLTSGPTTESSDPVEFAFGLLKEQLAEQDMDVVLDRGVEPGSVTNFANIKMLPENLFEQEVIAALKKVQSKSHLYQFDEFRYPNLPKWFTSIFDNTIAKVYAAITGLYNSLVYKYMNTWDTNMDRFEYLAEIDTIQKYQVRTNIRLGDMIRRVEVVHYLTAIVGEDKLDSAIEELSYELSLLNDAGLIMGSMVLPSIVELANPVGNGKKIYGIFAYPILNTKLFLEQEGEDDGVVYASHGETLQALFKNNLDITMMTLEGQVHYYGYKPPYEDLIVSREPLLAQTLALSLGGPWRSERVTSEETVVSSELERLYKQQEEDTARILKKQREQRQATKKD